MPMNMFVRNCWYVAAWSHEVAQGLFSRTILDEPICFRNNGMTLVARPFVFAAATRSTAGSVQMRDGSQCRRSPAVILGRPRFLSPRTLVAVCRESSSNRGVREGTVRK